MNSDIMSKAKAHFAEVMSGELKSFYIEEWDATIYYKQGTNFKAEGKVLELQQAGKTAEALIQMVINRCLDENGKKIFSDHQKPELMNSVDPDVIVKIVNHLTVKDEDEFTVEKAKKS